jgi:hypothetical protein
MADTHKGACFCGAVEVAVRGDPIDMGYCHCASCRAYSGAPLAAFAVWPAADVEVTAGGDLLGGFNKAGTSDRKHCTRCGGHVMIDHPHLGVVDIRAAVPPTVRFEPRAHLNYAEAVLPMRDGLPKFRDLPAAIGGSGELMPE